MLVRSRPRPVSVDIRDYSGIDAGGIVDSAAVINQAALDASNYALAGGFEKVDLIGFGRGVYRFNTRLLLRPRVHFCLDGARIVAGADIGANNSFVRAVETLTPATAHGVGDTTNGSNVIANLTSVASWSRGDWITGPGIPASTKVLIVDKQTNALVLDAAATATAAGVVLTRHATYYGTYVNCGLIGGEFDPNGYAIGAGVRALYTESLLIDGTRMLHNRKADGSDANWAYQVGGRKMRALFPEVLGGSRVFEDGFHFVHGQGLQLISPYVESGDDAIALGSVAPGVDQYLDADPDPIRNVEIVAGEVRAQRGYGLSVYVEATALGRDWEVTDYVVKGLTGYAGAMRNGGMRFQDKNAGAPGTSQIKRGEVTGVDLNVGSLGHDDVGDPEGIYIESVSDLSLKAKLRLTDAAGAANGFLGCTITLSEDVVLDLEIPALGRRFGISVGSSNRVEVTPRLRCTATNFQGGMWVSHVRGIKIVDGWIRDIPDGLYGLTFSSLAGTATRGQVKGTKFAQLAAGGFGILADPTTFQRLHFDKLDLAELASPMQPATATDGRTTTINHGGGYNNAATALTVADNTQVQYLDVIYVPRTREKMTVSSVAAGNVVNVVRGARGTRAVALNDAEPLYVYPLTIRDTGALDDFAPYPAYDKDTAHAGFLCIPPGGASTTQAAASNAGRVCMFIPSRDMVVRKLGFGVTAWALGDTANPTVDVAIYDDAWARLVSTGATAGLLNAVGAKSVAIAPTVLRAGKVYYLGLSVGALGTSTVTLAAITPGAAQTNQMFGAGAGQILCDAVAAGVHPLPNPWVFGGASSVGFLGAVLEG